MNIKEVERTISNLLKTEAGFTQTLDDAQNFLPEEEEQEHFYEQEALAEENFQLALAKVRDLGDKLITLKAVLNGLDDFNRQYTVVQDELKEAPSNLNKSIDSLRTKFSYLNQQWKAASLEMDHPVRHELNSCVKLLTKLEATAEKSDDDSTISSHSHHSTSGPDRIYYQSRSDLPTIDVPTFDGSIMGWSTFWASFKATIDGSPPPRSYTISARPSRTLTSHYSSTHLQRPLACMRKWSKNYNNALTRPVRSTGKSSNPFFKCNQ